MSRIPSRAQLKAQLKAAHARAQEALESPQRIVSAIHEDGYIVVEFANGYRFGIPIGAISELAGQPTKALRQIEVDPIGEGIRWDALDVDVAVPGLLVDALGSRALFAYLGSKGGSKSSEKKRAASKVNGMRGGRPPKPRPSGSGIFLYRAEGEALGYAVAGLAGRARKAAAKRAPGRLRAVGRKSVKKLAKKARKGARKRAKNAPKS
jgi:hypothetical protein